MTSKVAHAGRVEMLMAEAEFGFQSDSDGFSIFLCVCAICHACCNLRLSQSVAVGQRDVLRCSSLGIFTPTQCVSDAMLLGPLLSVYLYL